jgi:hypothetical protein
MATRNRGRWVAIFLALAVITVVFIVIAVSAHTTPCKGLSCPSGGGAAEAASGTSLWTVVGGVGGGVSGLGTLLSGIAALRKDKPAEARAGNPGTG